MRRRRVLDRRGASRRRIAGAAARSTQRCLSAALAPLRPPSVCIPASRWPSASRRRTKPAASTALDEIADDRGGREASAACRSIWTARASPTRSSQLEASPAEMTWKAGVDILSFGATKNGCIAAEALVFFDPAKAARRCLPAQARRPSFLEVALHRGAVRGVFRGRPLAASLPGMPTPWPTGCGAGCRQSEVHARPGRPTATRSSPCCSAHDADRLRTGGRDIRRLAGAARRCARRPPRRDI